MPYISVSEGHTHALCRNWTDLGSLRSGPFGIVSGSPGARAGEHRLALLLLATLHPREDGSALPESKYVVTFPLALFLGAPRKSFGGGC